MMVIKWDYKSAKKASHLQVGWFGQLTAQIKTYPNPCIENAIKKTKWDVPHG